MELHNLLKIEVVQTHKKKNKYKKNKFNFFKIKNTIFFLTKKTKKIFNNNKYIKQNHFIFNILNVFKEI